MATETRIVYGAFYAPSRESAKDRYRLVECSGPFAGLPIGGVFSLQEARTRLATEIRHRLSTLAREAYEQRSELLSQMTEIRRFYDATRSESAKERLDSLRKQVIDYNGLLRFYDRRFRLHAALRKKPNTLAAVYLLAERIGLVRCVQIECNND